MLKKLCDKKYRDRKFYWFMHSTGFTFLNSALYARETHKIVEETFQAQLQELVAQGLKNVDRETKNQ